MRKARAVLERKLPSVASKSPAAQSDQRLRQLSSQAQRTGDARKKAKLKEQFIREFYEGAR